MTTPVAAIILAAGKGTRMKSDLHKVMHPIAGRPMLGHLLASVAELDPAKTVVVVGDKAEQVQPLVAAFGGVVAIQDPQHGTAHAVQQAQGALAGFSGNVLILYGDVPFVGAQTMRRMLDRLEAGDRPAAVVLAFHPDDPAQYGRIVAAEDGTGPDPDGFQYVPTTWPGARLPHLWLDDGSALHDHLGRRFTLLNFLRS